MKVTKKILRNTKFNVASLMQVVDGSEAKVLRWPFPLHQGPVVACILLSSHYAYKRRNGRQDKVHHVEHGR